MIVLATPDFGAGPVASLLILLTLLLIVIALEFASIYAVVLLMQELRQDRKKGIGIGLSLALGVWLVCCGYYLCYYDPHSGVERLLSGDDQIELSSVSIWDGQQRIAEITDPASMRYLTSAFRAAVKEGHMPTHRDGWSYEAHVKLGMLRSGRVGLIVPRDEDGFGISFPMDRIGDRTHYWMPLTKPMPAPVAEAIRQMREHVEKGKEDNVN
jgi:hypothetical protein